MAGVPRTALRRHSSTDSLRIPKRAAVGQCRDTPERNSLGKAQCTEVLLRKMAAATHVVTDHPLFICD